MTSTLRFSADAAHSLTYAGAPVSQRCSIRLAQNAVTELREFLERLLVTRSCTSPVSSSRRSAWTVGGPLLHRCSRTTP